MKPSILALCAAFAVGCASTRLAGLCASLRGAGPGSDALDPEATGSARLEIHGTTVRYVIRVEGTGKIVATHIHKGREGENGPMVKELNPGFSTESSSGTAELPEELATELTRDPSGYYVKLHSLKFPGGAIRGQLASCAGGVPGHGSREPRSRTSLVILSDAKDLPSSGSADHRRQEERGAGLFESGPDALPNTLLRPLDLALTFART